MLFLILLEVKFFAICHRARERYFKATSAKKSLIKNRKKVTRGGGGCQKKRHKCHVFFEWPLTVMLYEVV
jgi:hypothetical protein